MIIVSFSGSTGNHCCKVLQTLTKLNIFSRCVKASNCGAAKCKSEFSDSTDPRSGLCFFLMLPPFWCVLYLFLSKTCSRQQNRTGILIKKFKIEIMFKATSRKSKTFAFCRKKMVAVDKKNLKIEKWRLKIKFFKFCCCTKKRKT